MPELTIRVINAITKKCEVKPHFLEHFGVTQVVSNSAPHAREEALAPGLPYACCPHPRALLALTPSPPRIATVLYRMTTRGTSSPPSSPTGRRSSCSSKRSRGWTSASTACIPRSMDRRTPRRTPAPATSPTWTRSSTSGPRSSPPTRACLCDPCATMRSSLVTSSMSRRAALHLGPASGGFPRALALGGGGGTCWAPHLDALLTGPLSPLFSPQQSRGFCEMFIWACPPMQGDDYILYW